MKGSYQMIKIISAILIGMLVFISCEKDDLAGEKANVIGENRDANKVFTLNSNDNKGFSVEELRLGDFPKIRPDFIIIPHTNQTGDVMSPFLTHPNLEKRFVIYREFEDSISAQACFDTYTIAPESADLQQFALDLKPNQIWLVKTRSGTYCKVLIMATHVDLISADAEIKFKAEKMI